MQTQISKDISLLSRDACTGTNTDLAQRDDQGAGSKTELRNGWTTQVPHEDAGRPQRLTVGNNNNNNNNRSHWSSTAGVFDRTPVGQINKAYESEDKLDTRNSVRLQNTASRNWLAGRIRRRAEGVLSISTYRTNQRLYLVPKFLVDDCAWDKKRWISSVVGVTERISSNSAQLHTSTGRFTVGKDADPNQLHFSAHHSTERTCPSALTPPKRTE